MTDPVELSFVENDLDAIATIEGRIVVFITGEGKLDPLARRVNRLTRGALARLAESDDFDDLKEAQGHVISMPLGLKAEAVQVIRLEKNADAEAARKAGATAAIFKGVKPLTVLAGSHRRAADIAYGVALRSYDFNVHRTADKEKLPNEAVAVMVAKPTEVQADAQDYLAVARGVFFTRDLTNEPANILTTTEFADRLIALKKLGIKVTVLEEAELEKLGMRTLLAVGQGSRSPTKVVVMEWKGGGKEQPFALVGKGVVFDTGGISLKPAAGMEDMTMDMGGAGVVAGTMMALAARKAKANVVGLVGLVENMPDGQATRPGDVIKSMKGDTVEITNTDAEGRLVLADVLWYAQDKFNPVGVINLATLTGAIIIALGHENAGVFSNSDDLSAKFLKAASTENEGAWRMPMGPAYAKQLKSSVADVNNVGGRPGGSITAAEFLKRFIREETPWIHLDIAGVAEVKTETDFAPKGATGWGVRSLDRLIRDNYEA